MLDLSFTCYGHSACFFLNYNGLSPIIQAIIKGFSSHHFHLFHCTGSSRTDFSRSVFSSTVHMLVVLQRTLVLKSFQPALALNAGIILPFLQTLHREGSIPVTIRNTS